MLLQLAHNGNQLRIHTADSLESEAKQLIKSGGLLYPPLFSFSQLDYARPKCLSKSTFPCCAATLLGAIVSARS
jgi:hypothetical protein